MLPEDVITIVDSVGIAVEDVTIVELTVGMWLVDICELPDDFVTLDVRVDVWLFEIVKLFDDLGIPEELEMLVVALEVVVSFEALDDSGALDPRLRASDALGPPGVDITLVDLGTLAVKVLLVDDGTLLDLGTLEVKIDVLLVDDGTLLGLSALEVKVLLVDDGTLLDLGALEVNDELGGLDHADALELRLGTALDEIGALGEAGAVELTEVAVELAIRLDLVLEAFGSLVDDVGMLVDNVGILE